MFGQILKTVNFSKIGLLIILSFGWMEKVFAWKGVPEGIYKMVETNPLTSWLTILGPMGPNYFLGYFELIVFILLIFKEKYGAILSCIIFNHFVFFNKWIFILHSKRRYHVGDFYRLNFKTF